MNNNLMEGEFQCNRTTMILSYICIVYISASLIYLILTRSIGTPFNDSLTEKQRCIKKESALIRKKIFLLGIIISLIGIFIVRPFQIKS